MAFAIIVGALVVGKAIYWVFKKVARALTARTKTKLDDIILDMIEEPVVFAVTLAGIWYGTSRLVLPDRGMCPQAGVMLIHVKVLLPRVPLLTER